MGRRGRFLKVLIKISNESVCGKVDIVKKNKGSMISNGEDSEECFLLIVGIIFLIFNDLFSFVNSNKVFGFLGDFDE